MRTKKTPTELPIGRIAGIFGIKGELKCDPTNAGRTLFSRGAKLRCERVNGTSETVRLKSVREHKGRLLIFIEGLDDPTHAESYAGATFFASRDDLDVGDDEYLDVDLVGCEVRSVGGLVYGAVQRVEHHPSNDMLVVNGRLLPMVHAFIRDIDMAQRRITVEVPPGLLDDDFLLE